MFKLFRLATLVRLYEGLKYVPAAEASESSDSSGCRNAGAIKGGRRRKSG